ncbi:DNA cytosine methyltransferase [candidate division KSB1 bacterium]|nr:DNA cytosine methyltransferase [candidate division KSB1 bacterium]
MRAIGITSGIGSMLIGAKQAGFKIIGNIEWRKYYHTGTFENNFNAPLWNNINDLTEKEVNNMSNADIAFGHP